MISALEECWPTIQRIARVWRTDPEPMRAFSPLIEVAITGVTPAVAA